MAKENKATPVMFFENAVYGTAAAAEILGRCDKTIRKLCDSGRLKGVKDKRGWLISGWSIREYVEGRCTLMHDK